MAKYVCNTASLKCDKAVMTFAQSKLVVLPEHQTFLSGNPMATFMDHVPYKNIFTFGLCHSYANPGVQAASGPIACTPVIPLPWEAPKETVTVGKKKALLSTSVCRCTLGLGTISITDPGQTKTKEG